MLLKKFPGKINTWGQTSGKKAYLTY